MRISSIATAAVLAGTLCGGQALAQQAITISTAPQARETDLNASVNVLYDSNIARSDREFAEARHLSLDDVITTPQANFTIARQFGRQVLFLEGYGSYVFHIHDTILNREDINVTGGVNAHILRCQELVTENYSLSQTDLAQQSVVAVQNVQGISTLSGSVDCGHSTGIAPTATVSGAWRDNSSQQLKSNNSNTFAANAGLGYRRPTFGTLSLFGSYTQAAFPNRILPIPGNPAYGYTLYAGGVTYDRHIGGRLVGVVTVSFSDLQPDSPLQPKFQGVTYDAELTYTLNARIDLQAQAIRAVVPSNYIGSNYSTNGTYLLTANYSLGTRITLGLTGDYKTQNTNIVDPNLPDQIKYSDTVDGLLSVTYTMTKRLSFTVTGGDEQRYTNLRFLNYNSVRAGITASITY